MGSTWQPVLANDVLFIDATWRANKILIIRSVRHTARAAERAVAKWQAEREKEREEWENKKCRSVG